MRTGELLGALRVFRSLVVLGSFACAPANSSQESPVPGVHIGAGLVQRDVFLECADLVEVTDLAIGRLPGEEREHLIVTGLTGFLLVDIANARVERSVVFSRTMDELFPNEVPDAGALDVDGDGQLELVRQAQGWLLRTSVHGSDGVARWIHPKPVGKPDREPSPNFTLAADIDGDRRLEFLMGFNATDEVHLVEDDGSIAFRQPWGPIGAAAAVDVNGDGVRDVVYVDGEALVARNGKGEVLARLVPEGGGYTNALHSIEGFGDPPKRWLVFGHHAKNGPHPGQNYHLVEPDAKRIGSPVSWQQVEPYIDSIPAPLGGPSSIAWAKLDQYQEQAPVAGISATWLRLRLFDVAHACVYEEVLAPPSGKTTRTDGALLFQPQAADRPARLLVSNGPVVRAYTLRAP